MNNANNNAKVMSFKAPPDVREKLERWAEDNMSSMNCEIIRSIRARADQERQREKAVR